MEETMNTPKNWLILRGLIREQRHWGSFLQMMKEKNPGATILALDHPGIGTESNRQAPTRVSAMVEDLRERFLKAQQNTSNLNITDWGIFGVSLGGMVVLEWAEMFPGDFKVFVAANTSASNASKLLDRFRAQNLKTLAKITFETDPVIKEKHILTMTTQLSEPQVLQKASEQALFALPKKKFTETALRQLLAASKFKLVPKNFKPNTRLVFLVSEYDQLVSPRCTENIAKLLNAPLHIHKGSNHDITTDAPEWVADKLLSF